MTQTKQTHISLQAWTLMFLLALIWGASFVSNQTALTGMGVLTVVAFRVGGACVALWAYVWARGLPVPRGAAWIRTCVFLGVFNNAVPFVLIVWGQTHIPSGLAGILNASTVIFGVALAAMVFPDERLTARKTVGVGLGLIGMVVTIGPAVLVNLDITSLGQLAILGSSLSYAVAAIHGRRALRGIRPEVASAGMLTVSTLIMVPAALMVDGLPQMAQPPQVWASLAYLALVSSAFAYILFYRALQLAGAGNLSLVTLMIAPIAVVLGAVLFDEALPVSAYLGLGLLALGMLVIDGRMVALLRAKPH